MGGPKGMDVTACLATADDGSCDTFRRGNCEVRGIQNDYSFDSVDICKVSFGS